MQDGVDPDVDLDDARREVLRRHARVIAEGGDPDTPLTASHAFRPPPDMTPAQGLGLLAAMALVLLSGFVNGHVADTLGVRLFATLLLTVAGIAAEGLRGVSPATNHSRSRVDRALLLGTLLFAVLTGSTVALSLLPALVHAAVARVMFASLHDDASLVEKAARLSHPLAPAFIGPYCRKLTAVWGMAFAVSAGMTAVFALGGFTHLHRTWTGWLFWSLLGVFAASEFFFRKAWFRYFGKGPFDRFLAGVFPPQNTERGRRSQAYLLRMREELARLAEAERRNAGVASGTAAAQEQQPPVG